MVIRNEKRCHVCKQTKPISQFYSDKCSPDGHVYQCTDCRKEYRNKTKERTRNNYKRYWIDHRDEINAKHRTWYSENLDAQRSRGRTKDKRDRAKRREYHRQWRQENKDKCRQYTKAYEEKYPERRHALRSLRRASKLRPGANFTAEEWVELCRLYDYSCLRCGRQEPDVMLTADHIIPLVHGGGNGIENIQPLCRRCNSAKNATVVDYRYRPITKMSAVQLGLFD